MGSDSPVNPELSTTKSFDSKIRQSAGTTSPTLRVIMSPMTNSSASTSCSSYSLIARATLGLSFSYSLAIAAPLYSWKNEKHPVKIMTTMSASPRNTFSSGGELLVPDAME